MATRVNVDNFVRTETARMFSDLQRDSGGVNRLRHNRQPASIEHQTVIRMNRDTLYSFAIVDVAAGATLTLPDAGGRYLSAMVVDQDHHVVAIHHDPGTHELTAGPAGDGHVFVAVRILVDPADPDDVAQVTALQDQLAIETGSATPYEVPEYDTDSLDRTRTALLSLAAGLSTFDRTFGTADQVDPVRHLIGTAAGWGGLPSEEATYVGVAPGLPPGDYELTVGDVPVDGFWSISVYDAEGYFQPNDRDAYSVNSVTADRNTDGAVTVRFGDGDAPNAIPTPDGWNYVVRLYRPRAAVLDGTWTFPSLAQTS